MDGEWWDGYTGQPQVIFDDFRPGVVKSFNTLLRILDRYPLRVPVKGSSIELSATVFVLTCPSRPEVMYHRQTEENVNQLLRRITSIVEFSTTGEQTILKDGDTPYLAKTKEELDVMKWNFFTLMNINSYGNIINESAY